MNKTQKIPTFRKGQALPADSLNHVVQALLGMITAGRGIDLKMVGQKLQISAEGGPIPRTGGGGGGDEFHLEVTAKDELPEPETTSRKTFGIVTAGDDVGMVCVINPARNGWDSITHLE